MMNPVLIERVGAHITVVKLNRPEARNAINVEMATLIAAAVAQSEVDPDVRAVVLTSTSDGVFCAGADLKVLAAGGARGLSTPEGGFAGLMTARRTRPWILAVAGAAMGGGLEMGLACDMIVAGQHATFGLPEVKRGIFAGGGGAIRLTRAIPRAVALEMLVTGEPISAARAFALGLVNLVVPTEDVLPAAIRMAEMVAAAAPIAVRETLALARGAAEWPEEELWRRSRAVGRRLGQTEDFKEGPRAFAQKRAPVWTGR